MMAVTEKISWSGRLVGVQPRIRLLRSFDERHHSYQGYVLRVNGTCGDQAGEFLVAVGQGAHEKHRFRAGMELSGQSVPVDAPRMETAGFYKTSGLKVLKDAEDGPPALKASGVHASVSSVLTDVPPVDAFQMWQPETTENAGAKYNWTT
jgi:hypothetical protein